MARGQVEWCTAGEAQRCLSPGETSRNWMMRDRKHGERVKKEFRNLCCHLPEKVSVEVTKFSPGVLFDTSPDSLILERFSFFYDEN